MVEMQEYDFLMKDKGTYEPAFLMRVTQNVLSSLSHLSATSMTSSPSSSSENHSRTVGDSGMQRTQTASSQSSVTEPPMPSLVDNSATALSDFSASLKDIHECFISAALGSLVYSLCHDHGFVPLNSRTLILTTDRDGTFVAPISKFIPKSNAITLATLDVNLTPSGALVLKAYSDTAPGLRCLVNSSSPVISSTEASHGIALWLAPGGNAAKFYGIQDEKNLPGNLPISQLQNSVTNDRQHAYNSITINSWQSKCLEWLSDKGLNAAALEQGGWIFVQLFGDNSTYSNADYQRSPKLDDLTIVPWPRLLCFQTSSIVVHDLEPFISVDIAGRDPLSFATEWFMSKDERASTFTKRQRDRQMAETRSQEQADLEARNVQSTTYSPLALRRGSNAGAMYPTPPDAPHHPIAATPSFDGQVATPGNPNQLFSHDLAATPQNLLSGPMEIESDVWSSSGKKDRTNSSVNFNSNDNDNDPFGDGGGDLFGDVTDADFSFFDEPDLGNGVQGSIGPAQTSVSYSQEANASSVAPDANAPIESARVAADVVLEEDRVINETHLYRENQQTSMQPPSNRKEGVTIVQGEANIGIERASTPSPTFNKEAIFDRLLTKTSEEPDRRSSIFNKVNFDSSVLSVDMKYGIHGRFSFSTEENPLEYPRMALPTTEYLSRRRKVNGEQKIGSLLQMPWEDRAVVAEVVDSHPMLHILDPELASQASEQDDTSITSEDCSLVLNPGVKRKWTVDNESGDDMAYSFNALAVEYEQSVGTPLSIRGSQIPPFDADAADWPLTTYFTSPEPDSQSSSLSDLEYIAVAQILADQAVSGTTNLPGAASHVNKDNQACHSRSSSTRDLLQTVEKVAKACFTDVAACNMQSFLDIQGIPVLKPGLRLPPRPVLRGSGPDPSRSVNPFSIPPPQLEVRRSDSVLSILPSAISFWENLGLGPSRGSKDVSAIGVHPHIEGMADNVGAFLDQMRSVYESFRLGSHEKIVAKDLNNSLVHFAVDSSQLSKQHRRLANVKQSTNTLTVLKETMARLSSILSTLPLDEKNIVIYFIFPVDNATLLVHICTAFQHLFDLYRRAISEKKSKTTNELVLQLIPMNFVASPTSVMVPLPADYARLAMEVYDRCINFSSASSAPAILLEQPLPKSIDFKMTSTPSPSVLQENSCLHIAYAQSIDERWITAAWTDNRGMQQMTVSYCLGRKNEPISMPFSDVANEIWETTMDTISAKKIHWRVMIAKIGVMKPSEIEFWAGLQSNESGAQINLTLITVQTDPSLRLLPTSITLSPNANAAQSVITPVSTPQALQSSIVSPDQSTTPSRDSGGTAVTPGENLAEPDRDAQLIDYTDQSWGAVLAHSLNNSNSLLEMVPALISGYLIKRGGTNLDDPPIVMEVNIVYSEVVSNLRTIYEALLREILGYYRGLETLARVRGVVDLVNDVRPCHIAAAEKAVKALYMLM